MTMIRDANWVLSAGTFLPLAGVLALLVVPRAMERAIRTVALATAAATAALATATGFVVRWRGRRVRARCRVALARAGPRRRGLARRGSCLVDDAHGAE